MAVATAEDLLDRLEQSGLVAADLMLSLRRWVAAERSGVGQLAEEALARDLLTRYQLREVAAGRADGLTLGPYQLIDLIGEGGMGRVFRGRHTRLGREVAVKLVRPERLAKATTIGRFLHEIRVAARLHHPNVVLAFDADVIDGTPYYAMEFVPGADLGKVVAERGPLPVAEACGYIRQAADGLQHAADLGLVHRDVKPTNLLLTPDGRVKVLDLGLALLTADPDSGTPNRVGTVVGSPDYLAPEQARHAGGVDTRADVYALGCTLFFLLTGRPPFGGDTPRDKVLRHLNDPPPSVLADRPDVPPGVDAVVRWMLAKAPADRPQSPAAVAAALAPFAPTTSGTATIPPPPAEVSLFAELEGATAVVVKEQPRPWRTVTLMDVLTNGSIALIVLALIVGLALRWSGGPGPLPAEFVNPVGMKLVRLDGGPFMMGSPNAEPGRAADESATAVSLDGPFYIGATEVTNGQYQAVMGHSPARWPGRMRDAKSVPVDSVTLDEATEFCRRLTARDSRRAGWAYRLPTEAECEFAARGGTTTPFWAGERLQFAVTGVFDPDPGDGPDLGEPVGKGAETRRPHPAGGTQPNPFGLYDVCGNVWEWATDRSGGAVLRGGSWKEPATRCRSASRRRVPPDTRADDVGFRVVFSKGDV